MISTELADIHRICRHVDWRCFDTLPGDEYPRFWFMLSFEETFELAQTGTYSVPVEIVPAPVQEWRTIMDGAAALTSDMLTLEALEMAASRG